MSTHETALDAAQALDKALTLADVHRLDRAALVKFQGVLYHWQQIAVGELDRRRELKP